MLLALLGASVALPAIVVTARPAVVRKLTDTELRSVRGGFLLPNGLDVSLGIDIQTRVNGLLVLRTVYAAQGPDLGIRVFTDGTHVPNIPPTTATLTAGPVTGTPVLVVDRSPTGTTIIPASSTPAATVNLVNGDPSLWQSGEGQTQVPVTANGPAVAAEPGAVSLTTSAAGSAVTLKATDFEIQQLVGQATGVVVANTANDRAIDTVSAVNVDIRGMSPGLLSGLFAAQRMALQGLITR